MKSVKLVTLLTCILSTGCFANSRNPRQLSSEEAEAIAQKIYAESVNQSIEDVEAIANIIGSIIIREIRSDNSSRQNSEENKRKVTAAIGYIVSLIITSIKKRRSRKLNRGAFLLDQEQLLIDQIAEKIREISDEN